MEHPRARCDGCGGNLEPWEQDPVIFDCFHALHATCAASGSVGCPLCRSAGEEDPPATRCEVCGDPLCSLGEDKCMNYCSSPCSTCAPRRTPSPYYYDVDEVEQAKPPTATTAITTAPSQYGGTVPLFGQQPPAPANPFQPPAQFAPPPSVFQQYPHQDQFRPPPCFYGPPLPPPPQQQQQHYQFQTRTFEYQQQPPPPPQAPPAPACFTYAPPPAVPPYCVACGGAVVRGQTTVTSQCNHTFHFRCFAGGAYACPACGAQWSDVGPAIPPPSYRY